AVVMAEALREQLPMLRIVSNCGGGSFKSQFKKADKSGASIALILGDQEVDAGTVNVKWLRDEAREQQSVAQAHIASLLGAELQLN
ncbi:MAG TPA: His/Gly/Thr/Pro-type tRNA ligase C-terminal domain-containing protein, partial [Spongiibacteraceae bacterium]|nr:His/Gly/Thr/Pro-type tRNA ligase C-terminal domain-containing protein [Spongiibacteraceae bacterium]